MHRIFKPEKTELLRAILLLLLPLVPISSLAQPDERPNFDNWFQVEIIIFRQKQILPSDEFWDPVQTSYPADIVAISPADDNLITPYALSQTVELNSDGQDFIAVDEGQNGKRGEANNTFLFADRGNRQRNQQLLAAMNEEANTGRLITDTETNAANETNKTDSVQADFVAAEAILDSRLPEAFRALSGNELKLASIARSIRRSSRYDLLLHQGWRQPINKTPTPVLIQTGKRVADQYEIDGDLSISRSRFLHLDTNLWFTEFEALSTQNYQQQANSPVTTAPDFSAELLNQYPQLAKVEKNKDIYIAVQSYPLRHSRRLRSSELHYIDHPYFGVLVKIDRFEYQLDSPDDQLGPGNL